MNYEGLKTTWSILWRDRLWTFCNGSAADIVINSFSHFLTLFPVFNQRNFPKLWGLDFYQILWLLLQPWLLQPPPITWHYALHARPPTLTPITTSCKEHLSACCDRPRGPFAPHTGRSSSPLTDAERARINQEEAHCEAEVCNCVPSRANSVGVAVMFRYNKKPA